jgi:hypothetical protein
MKSFSFVFYFVLFSKLCDSWFLQEGNECNCFLAASVAHQNISVPNGTKCMFKIQVKTSSKKLITFVPSLVEGEIILFRIHI